MDDGRKQQELVLASGFLMWQNPDWGGDGDFSWEREDQERTGGMEVEKLILSLGYLANIWVDLSKTTEYMNLELGRKI